VNKQIGLSDGLTTTLRYRLAVSCYLLCISLFVKIIAGALVWYLLEQKWKVVLTVVMFLFIFLLLARYIPNVAKRSI